MTEKSEVDRGVYGDLIFVSLIQNVELIVQKCQTIDGGVGIVTLECVNSTWTCSTMRQRAQWY